MSLSLLERWAIILIKVYSAREQLSFLPMLCADLLISLPLEFKLVVLAQLLHREKVIWQKLD